MFPNPPVHFHGIVIGPSGLAGQGRQWLWALEAAGFSPSLSGYGLGQHTCVLPPDEEELIQRCVARPRRPGGITFHHALIPHFKKDDGAEVNVLQTIFETEGLPPGWGNAANEADAVIVVTEFNRRTFAAAGVSTDKLHVLPPPFAGTHFEPRRGERRTGPFRWLSVFDWQQRKGPDVLLAAFGRAFARDEAELILKIMPDDKFTGTQIAEYCTGVIAESASGQPPEVRVIDDSLDAAAVVDLYREADGLVLASRGEGWGRPVHEAMLMQLPVVVPFGSSLQTLVPDMSVGYPVRCSEAPVSELAAREVPVFRGLTWHEPDARHLMQSMREVVADPDGARQRGVRGRKHVLRLCDPQRVSTELRSLLDGLWSRPRSAGRS